MTPQVRISTTPAAQFSTPIGRGTQRSVFSLMPSLRLSAVCAAAGVLMVFGGSQPVQAPVHNVVQSMPSTSKPKPVEPQQAQQAQKASGGGAASYKSCAQIRGAGAARHHSSEPGHRPAVDREHDGKVCER